jgi:hypothetical protein
MIETMIREAVERDRDWWRTHARGACDAYFDLAKAALAAWVVSVVLLCALIVTLLSLSPLASGVLAIVGIGASEAYYRWKRRIGRRFLASMGGPDKEIR